jgi:hypothetical protein
MKEIEVKTVEEIAPKPTKKESIFNLY